VYAGVRRMTLALPLILFAPELAGCTKIDPLFCSEEKPCSDPERPFCDLEGVYPASEGRGRTCIPDPYAGLVDAGNPDGASSGTVDAGDDPADAAAQADADVAPVPPVTNGQSADLVLGQPDFTSSEANNGGRSERSLSWPQSVAAVGDRLWVADAGNARVLQWNAMPVPNFAAADLVLGQLWFDSNSSDISSRILGGVFGPFQVLEWGPTAAGLSCPILVGTVFSCGTQSRFSLAPRPRS
jgi:hypothetical protein